MHLHFAPSRSAPAIGAWWATLALATSLSAQAYATAVVARGLQRPTGIVAADDGTLWFTEVPQPGMAGGTNTVSRLDPNGTKTVLVMGEPQPTHLARAASGDLYWTCSSAGVIQRLAGGTRTTFLRSLLQPSGVAIGGDQTLYFTQVPTPGMNGMNGGRNTVSRWTMAGGVQTITMGEPEPRDVAVDGQGNLYWTCKSANVILWRNATTGMVAPLLTGLDQPSGIAVDRHGALYFTEVPTPGINGNNGGRNRVTRYVPATQTLTLVNYGDPEPFDVAVTADGSSIYWTCSSAGVIVRATATRAPVTLSTMQPLRMGAATPLLLRASEQGNRLYVAATSFGRGPLRFGREDLSLTADPLLTFSLSGSASAVFAGYMGRLDATGAASAAIVLPQISELRGVALFTAYVVLDPMAPAGLIASDTLRLVAD
jgi:streptogramin lyase